MVTIYTLLVAHFVADFLCQTDWMALNKSKRWDALFVHAWVYTSVVSALVSWATYFTHHFQLVPLASFAMFWWATFATHFVQDAITSRWTSRLWFLQVLDEQPIHSFTGAGPFYIVRLRPTRHWFFVVIGFDQLLHYVTLFVTASWWLR